MSNQPGEPQRGQGPSFWPLVPGLCLYTGIFFCVFLTRVGLGPILPEMEKHFSIGHSRAGVLVALVTAGYFVTVLFSGVLSSRLGNRGAVLTAAAGMALTLWAAALAAPLWALAVCLAAAGLASGPYLPSGMAAITTMTPKAHWGKAIAVHQIAPNLALFTAPLLAEMVLPHWGYQGVLAVMGSMAAFFCLAYFFWGKGGRQAGAAPSPGAVLDLARMPEFWVMVGVFALGTAASQGVFAMMPLYMIGEHGMTRSHANFLLSATRISTLVLAFLAGWACDRLGPRRTLFLVLSLSGAATACIGLFSGSWFMAALFAQPLCLFPLFPAGFMVLSSMGRGRSRGLAVSFAVPPGFLIGGGITPALLGVAGEAASLAAGITVLGVIITAGALLPLRLDKPEA